MTAQITALNEQIDSLNEQLSEMKKLVVKESNEENTVVVKENNEDNGVAKEELLKVQRDLTELQTQHEQVKKIKFFSNFQFYLKKK